MQQLCKFVIKEKNSLRNYYALSYDKDDFLSKTNL